MICIFHHGALLRFKLFIGYSPHWPKPYPSVRTLLLLLVHLFRFWCFCFLLITTWPFETHAFSSIFTFAPRRSFFIIKTCVYTFFFVLRFRLSLCQSPRERLKLIIFSFNLASLSIYRMWSLLPLAPSSISSNFTLPSFTVWTAVATS